MKSMKNISNTGMKYTSKNRSSTQANIRTSKQKVVGYHKEKRLVLL